MRYSVGWEIRYTTCEGLYENTDELVSVHQVTTFFELQEIIAIFAVFLSCYTVFLFFCLWF